jgi:phenylacetate-CoA ligase
MIRKLYRIAFKFYNLVFNRRQHLPMLKSFSRSQFRNTINIPYQDKKKIDKIKLDKLKNILNYAINNIPYYKDIIIDNDNFTINELYKFPIVNKKIIQNNFKLFLPKSNKILRKSINSHTSGSSGLPFHFHVPKNSYSIENLILFRAWYLTGVYKLGDPIINLRSYSPKSGEKFWSFDKENSFIYLSAFHINENTINEYVDLINKSDSKILRGYPSSVYIFSIQIEKANLKLTNIQAVITSSETLLPIYKSKIKDILNVPIFDWYGLNERLVTVQQCVNGNYHNNDDYGIIEIGNDNHIIGTSLHNDVMPFIRYDTLDIAINQETPLKCNCGLNFSIPFHGIEGRSDDLLYKFDNTPIPTVNLYTALYEIDEIAQFKLVQLENKSLELFIVLSKNSKNINEEKILQIFINRLGPLSIDIIIVDSIERNLITGKVKTFESEVNLK